MSQQLITANEISTTSGVANTGIVGLITSSQLAPDLSLSGNLGLGVTPSAWAQFKAIEIGTSGVAVAGFAGRSYQMDLVTNSYYNGGWKYSVTGYGATRYEHYDGTHAWSTAPSGTSGNAITFTQSMTLNASGYLSIGTTSPATRFHVYEPTSATAARFLLNSAVTGSTSTDGFGITIDTVSDAFLDQKENANLILRTNATERMRITAAGLVGVGTASPVSPLTVSTNITSNDGGYLKSLYYSSGWKYSANTSSLGFVIAADSNGVYLSTAPGSGTVGGTATVSERMRIDGSGNVGIGTNSPASSGGYTALTLNNATNSGYVVLQTNGTTTSDWYVSGGTVATIRGVAVPLTFSATGANYIAASTNGSERMRITSDGDVGIGTNTPITWNGAVNRIFQSKSTLGNSVISAASSSVTANQGGIFEAYATGQTSGSTALGSLACLRENTSTTSLSSYVAIYNSLNGSVKESVRIDSGSNINMLGGGQINNSSGRPMLKQTGGVLQILQTLVTGTLTTTSTSLVAMTGFEATITPSSTSSKILVMIKANNLSQSTQNIMTLSVLRNGSYITSTGNISGGLSTARYAFGSGGGGHQGGSDDRMTDAAALDFLDSPASTSPQTYSLYWYTTGGTGYLNQWALNNDKGSISSITLWEIAG